ncbi:MAG TPA: hypothetical protein DIU15_14390 [Deltaproteobacteria bacterium]|nr:hypothetical protein [Deltaproteobacteria bacterium]HCP47228.1 hypothetical protein [Deltaproteobacteria bacterium]
MTRKLPGRATRWLPVGVERVPSRRTVLRGLLGGAAVTVGLPPLEAFLNASGTAYADGCSLPARFGLFFWGNGVLPDRWIPQSTGQGDEWSLSDQLAPLADVKHLISVVSGTEVRVVNEIPHYSGAAGFLSGIAPLGEEGDNTFAGPSIDQIIAAEIGGETRFRSLEVGAHPGAGLSFNGPHSSNPPETSPHALFERLFGAGFTAPGEEPVIDPRLGLRRSVLDAVMERIDSLKGRVGASDQIRLEQHFDGIRDLELRLARMEEDPPDLAACLRPEEPILDEAIASLSQRNRLLCDLIAMSLACDQARVFSNVFTRPVDNFVFPGMEDGHHRLTHDEVDPQPQVHEVMVQIMAEVAYFIESLNRIQEGDGTLLDHCAVLATTDVSYGRTHSLDDFPIIVSGGACGALRQGLHYRSTTRENASQVMLTLIRAMGILAPEFGSGDAHTTEGLGAIEL